MSTFGRSLFALAIFNLFFTSNPLRAQSQAAQAPTPAPAGQTTQDVRGPLVAPPVIQRTSHRSWFTETRREAGIFTRASAWVGNSDNQSFGFIWTREQGLENPSFFIGLQEAGMRNIRDMQAQAPGSFIEAVISVRNISTRAVVQTFVLRNFQFSEQSFLMRQPAAQISRQLIQTMWIASEMREYTHNPNGTVDVHLYLRDNEGRMSLLTPAAGLQFSITSSLSAILTAQEALR